MIRWAATDHKCALSISTVAQNQYPWVLKPIFAQQSLAFSWLEQPPWSVQEELWAWKVSQTLHIRHLDSWEMPLSFQTFQILNRESSGLVWTLSPVCMEMSKAIAKGSGLEGHKCAQTLSRDEKSNVRPSLEQERFYCGCNCPCWRMLSSSPHKHEKRPGLVLPHSDFQCLTLVMISGA